MSATRRSFDSLWPVLLALMALISGAIALGVIASHRASEGRLVVIAGAETFADDGSGDNDDDDGTPGTAPAETGPVDADHAAARLAARRGERDQALALYERSASAHPDSAAVLAERGYLLLAVRQAAAAQVSLARAAELAPEAPWISLNLGVALARGGDLAGAEARYRQALALRPGYNAAELALGAVLRKLGRLDEATAVLEQASRGGSNDERAHAQVALGRAYLAGNRRDAAIRAFERAIEFAPSAVEIRLDAARAWLATGRSTEVGRALELLVRAAELAPDVAAVQVALGRVLEKRDDPAGAEQAYERALRLDPDHRYARRRLLRLALDRRDFARARAMAESLLAAAPEEAEHHFLAGLVAARDDHDDEARKHYADAIARAGDQYPEAWFNLGILEKGADHLDAAIAAYRTAITQRADYQQAYNNLGLALAQSDKPDEAEAAYRQALALDEGYAAAWLNLGKLLAGRDRTDEAVAAFDRALTARPGYREARLNLGVALSHGGRTAEAIATYRALVAEEPRYTTAWYDLGIALAGSGDDAGAEQAWRTVLSLDHEHLASLRKLAALEALAGRTREALATYAEVLDRMPDDQGARLAVAELRLATGDRAGCAHELRAVLSVHPDDARATNLLESCGAAGAVPVTAN